MDRQRSANRQPTHRYSAHADIAELLARAWKLRHDDTRRARAAAERARLLALERQDAHGGAFARLRLALCDHVLGVRGHEAVARIEACCAEMQALGHAEGQGEALNLLANVLASQDRHTEAVDTHLRCEALRRELGDDAGVAASLNNRAISLRALGRLDEALALLQDSLRLARLQGDESRIAYALVNLGATELACGAAAAAALHFEQGFAATTRTDDRALECTALTGLARARIALGDVPGARLLLSQAQALARRTGNVRDAARVSLALALADRADGLAAPATLHLQAALQQAGQAQDRTLERELRSLLAPADTTGQTTVGRPPG